MAIGIIEKLRQEYHRKICAEIFGLRPGSTVYSNADDSSKVSVELANGIAAKLCRPPCPSPPTGQKAGALFTQFTSEFIDDSFRQLQHLRPGKWNFSSSQSRTGIASYHQYEHLADLRDVLDKHTELKAALGGDYLITPDIMISRSPMADTEINIAKTSTQIIGKKSNIAGKTPLRSVNHQHPTEILHASVSCKWTMRSDRAQNTRTEALNIIRNRKGKIPHIVAVTFEPLPSRIASIALGTGDIDCTYHGALYELLETAKELKYDDSLEMLNIMVDGRRLRDISDLPFDLAV